MDIYLSGMVDWKMKQLLVEGKFIDVDEIGGFSLDINKLIEKENPIAYFDAWLSTVLTNEEIIGLYTLWGNSRAMTLLSMMSATGKTKPEIKEIIMYAIKHGVLSTSWNNTYRVVNEIIRDRMRINARKLSDERGSNKQKPQEDMDVVKKSLQSMKKNSTVDSEEEVAYDPEVEGSVQGTLQTVAIKPGIPISRKILTKKKPALGKSLVQSKKRV